MSKFSAGFISVSLLVAASAQEPMFKVPGASTPAAQPAAPAAAPAAPAAPVKKFTEAQVAEAYGWYLGAQMGLRQLEFTKAEVDALARGIIGSAGTGQPGFNAQEMGPELEAFLAKKQEGYLNKLRMAQLSEGAAFFTKLKENKAVVELPSGLRYEITKDVKGAFPKVGQQVTMHYTLSLPGGQTIESTLQPRQQGGAPEPVPMVLLADRVIPGMFEGLQKVPVGGKAKLYIPPSLAYGDQGSQVIPPGATLIFDVEVLSVGDAPKEPAVPAAK